MHGCNVHSQNNNMHLCGLGMSQTYVTYVSHQNLLYSFKKRVTPIHFMILFQLFKTIPIHCHYMGKMRPAHSQKFLFIFYRRIFNREPNLKGQLSSRVPLFLNTKEKVTESQKVTHANILLSSAHYPFIFKAAFS